MSSPTTELPRSPMTAETRIKISQLRAFVTVAQHGNFSEAALEMGLSQSTVSYAIAALEDELGVVLLNRGRHGATLTPCGEAILPEAHQMMKLLDSIQQKANRHRGLQGGEVRIATPRSVATHLLPRVIAQFRERFPEVSVAIGEHTYYTTVNQAIREGQADIGFTLLPVEDGLETQTVFQDEFVVLLPPNTLHPDEPLTWDRVGQLSLIMTPVAPPHRHARTIMEHIARFGQKPAIAYEVQQDSTVISMVHQGLGASVMARLAAEPIPADIQVRSLPEPLSRAIAIITAEDALLSQATFAFLDQLRVALPTWQASPIQTLSPPDIGSA